MTAGNQREPHARINPFLNNPWVFCNVMSLNERSSSNALSFRTRTVHRGRQRISQSSSSFSTDDKPIVTITQYGVSKGAGRHRSANEPNCAALVHPQSSRGSLSVARACVAADHYL